MNAEGEVVALVQKNSDKESTSSYAIGIGYAKSLSITALSANDFTLNTIGIKKGLPEDESQALVYLYMSSSNLPTEEYLNLLNEFIQQYPKTVKVIPAVLFVTWDTVTMHTMHWQKKTCKPWWK